MTPVAAAKRELVAGRRERDELPPRLAAEAAHVPGGRTVDEIEALIRSTRQQAA